MQEYIIRTQKLNFYYSDQQALSEISLGIPENNICALIGPSGCGKSTFLRCINRMNELLPNTHTGGSVFLKGQDIYAENVDPVEVRKKVGMVFQKPNPFPKSIYDNIAWGVRINGIKHHLDDIVETNLKKAGLWNEVKDKLKKNALSLSGGQQQRLCIARAIAISPEVILMDEPTSSLDPISTSVIESLIVELKKSYTIIIVTHNMQQAGRVSDITSFFLHGKIIEHGNTKELFYNPNDKRTEDYITGKFG